MFDFKERLIKPESLHEGWQTGGSTGLTRLAFNLWSGYVEEGDERMSTPYEMCHKTEEPIYITKNGYGDMVIMSMENYESTMKQFAMYRDIMWQPETRAFSALGWGSHCGMGKGNISINS